MKVLYSVHDVENLFKGTWVIQKKAILSLFFTHACALAIAHILGRS